MSNSTKEKKSREMKVGQRFQAVSDDEQVHWDANGWAIIAAYLKHRKKRQNDLANLLKISPAAITQFKRGDSLLNARQIALILDFLNVSAVDRCEFYTHLLHARLIDSSNSSAERKDSRLVVKNS